MGTVKATDVRALIVGTLLGFVGTFFVYIGGRQFEYLGAFLIVSLFFPLIVSFVSPKRIILFGLVPNAVMTLCLTIYLLFFSPDFLGFELIYVVPVMFGFSIFLGLLVLVPIQLWRRKKLQDGKIEHIYKPDS